MSVQCYSQRVACALCVGSFLIWAVGMASEFLCKFKGHPVEEASWEPADDVSLLLRLAATSVSSLINLSAKFGAPHEEAITCLEAACRHRLDVRGFSFHVGSQCTDPADYVAVLASVRKPRLLPVSSTLT